MLLAMEVSKLLIESELMDLIYSWHSLLFRHSFSLGILANNSLTLS